MRMCARCGSGRLRYLLCKERRYRHDGHRNACTVGIADPDACACGDSGSKYAESVGIGGSGGKQRDRGEWKQLDKRIRQRVFIGQLIVIIRRRILRRKLVIFVGRLVLRRKLIILVERFVFWWRFVLIGRFIIRRKLIIFIWQFIIERRLVLIWRLGSGHDDSC